MAADTSQNFDPLVKALVPPREQKDPTLQNPNCAFQILKRHFARYTPEFVEQACGCPKDKFLEVAQTMVDNSGPERTGSMAYAVAWTQHTIGVQIIRAAGILQQLLGNIGRPGGGILALRGHASIQGSTDNPTLYHSITGYMAHPSILARHETLKEYLATTTVPTSYYSNTPKFVVSYLKAMYGDKATKENDYGYGWHPRISGDHSHIPMMIEMADGKVRACSPSARIRRLAARMPGSSGGRWRTSIGWSCATTSKPRRLRSGTRRRRSRLASCAPPTSRPRCSSCPPPIPRKAPVALPTPTDSCSGTKKPRIRPATRAPTSGSPTSSASGSRPCTRGVRCRAIRDF